MILDNTTRKIQIVLDGAVATTQPVASITFVHYDLENNQTRPGFIRTATNSATDVDLLPAPPSNYVREVKSLYVHNKDTASRTVTLKYDDVGTETEIIKKAIAAGETLIYEQGAGWQVM